MGSRSPYTLQKLQVTPFRSSMSQMQTQPKGNVVKDIDSLEWIYRQEAIDFSVLQKPKGKLTSNFVSDILSNTRYSLAIHGEQEVATGE